MKFEAMGCPCEVLVDSPDPSIQEELGRLARDEALRIERKYSRYRPQSVTSQLNAGGGRPVKVDDETAALLDFASQAYDLSDGLFDITTGVLRRLWRFDGGSTRVDERALASLLERVGWDQVRWEKPFLTLPEGFEIDLDGVAKEYAADRILSLLRERRNLAMVVNLGGDIALAGERVWAIGIEDSHHPGKMAQTIGLKSGAVATSGTAKRFTQVGARTLSHILNPKTGWPVDDPPDSVTVAAATCTEAGFWSTLAMLQGSNAETFLRRQNLKFWCYRAPACATAL